mgnify:FL=1
MVQGRGNLSDEELGLSGRPPGQLPLTAGYPIAEDLSQKLMQEKYENWLRMNLHQSPPPTNRQKREHIVTNVKDVDSEHEELAGQAQEALAIMVPKFGGKVDKNKSRQSPDSMQW